MSTELILIGTVHHDPCGYEKLSALLSTTSPRLITLEFSPYGRGFRTKNRHRLSQQLLSLYWRANARIPCRSCGSEHGALPASMRSLLATITYPFEFLAVRDYARRCKLPFYCIDLSHISRQNLRILKQEALSADNIDRLLTVADKNSHQSVEMCYKKAWQCWHATGSSTACAMRDISGDAEREWHMSRRIRNLFFRHPHKRLVHVGGWEHMTDHPDRVTLYTLLKDISPTRILLADDSFPPAIMQGGKPVLYHS